MGQGDDVRAPSALAAVTSASMLPAADDAAPVGAALDVPPLLHAAATRTIAAPSVNSRGAKRVLLKCSSTFWRDA